MRIPVEDRTDETPSEQIARLSQRASPMLVMAAIQVSDASPAVAVGGLALALGRTAARTGAALDEVLLAVRTEYERVGEALAAQSRGTEN
jgi:hypothetical protein